MVAELGWYWLIRDRYADAVHWIDRTLAIADSTNDPALRARALFTKALSLFPLGRHADQVAALADLEATARALNDPATVSRALQWRARRVPPVAQPHAADALADAALDWAQASGDRWEIANASYEKAMHAATFSELDERLDRAASLLEEVGNTHELASLFAMVPYAALRLDRGREAIELAERAIPVVREHGTPYHWMVLCGNLGLAALMTGDIDRAADAFCEELTRCRELVVMPLAAEGSAASPQSPHCGTTTSEPHASPEPQPHTATTSLTTPSTPKSRAGFSSPHARASALTSGTQPATTARHSASRTRSPTRSTSRAASPDRTRRLAATFDRAWLCAAREVWLQRRATRDCQLWFVSRTGPALGLRERLERHVD
jgi:hypothetical protein